VRDGAFGDCKAGESEQHRVDLPARYVGHQGDMPMSVTWRLIYPLPGDLLAQYRAAVA
jgi:hypothetical protein